MTPSDIEEKGRAFFAADSFARENGLELVAVSTEPDHGLDAGRRIVTKQPRDVHGGALIHVLRYDACTCTPLPQGLLSEE